MKEKRQKAEKNLQWLLGDMRRDEIASEMRNIEHSIQEERLKKQSFKLLFSSSTNLRGIILVIGMSFFGMMTGCGATGTYSSFMFSPSETLTTNEFTVLYGAASLISVISPFIIEKVDRRPMMIGCFIAVTFFNLCSFLLMYLHNSGHEIMYYPWLIFSSISLYSMCMALSGPVGYTLKGELLPFSVRAIGSSMGAAAQSFSSFWVAKMFHPITENFGMETNFLLYFMVSSSLVLLYYYFLPETRGKTLHELQNWQTGEIVRLEEVDGETTVRKLISKSKITN